MGLAAGLLLAKRHAKRQVSEVQIVIGLNFQAGFLYFPEPFPEIKNR